MSSHREAPEISKDPVADNADVYAFVSPDAPDTVTIISNFVPLQNPAGGPNFFEFGDDVLYSIYVDNDGDAMPDIEYQFQFTSTIENPNTFLYNTGPVTSLDSPNWNRRQSYSVTRIDGGSKGPHHGSPPGPPAQGGPAFTSGPTRGSVIGTNLSCPPCNIGPRSTPDYEANLGSAAVHSLASGERVFCGQRNDPFYVDLGSIFDLGDLRPFQFAHLVKPAGADMAAPGVDGTKALNIHTIAIQVPIAMLTNDGSKPASVTSPASVLGVWSGAARRKVQMFDDHTNRKASSGPWVQVSRLGNPLFNEVIVPLGKKDEWNSENPADDAEYLPNVQHPELGGLIPALYPGVFPNLGALTAARADLVAILLTGIPSGIVAGFQNYTGSRYADMLRLNVAIPPTAAPSPYGILGGDLAGFPNGRRVADDVVAIELRAIAGATYPLVDSTHTFVPDAHAGDLTDGTGPGPNRYLTVFPYVGTPYDGFDTPAV
ncbi:MAG TPA: DUF4331 domain-containing protein [Gaiellaceae bacterium]|nr:DUF4331 domain-containing protein [Gaiellaceae bacterium]